MAERASNPGDIRVELVPVGRGALTDRHIEQWEALAEQHAPCHHKNTFAWFDAHRGIADFTNGRQDVVPVAIRRDDQTIGYLNVDLVTDRLAFTAAERVLFGFSMRVGVVHYPGFAADPDAVPDLSAWRQLLDRLGGVHGQVDALHFETLPEGWPLTDAITRADAVPIRNAARHHGLILHSPHAPQTRHWIEDAETLGRFSERFSSKTRGTLRRKERRLAEKLAPLTVTESRTAEEMDRFFSAARVISQHSWQGRLLGDRFPEHVRVAAKRLAEIGRTRAFLLCAGEQPLSFVMGVLFQGVFYLDELAYDMRYAEDSPGQILLNRCLESLHTREEAWRRIDMQYGDAPYKRQVATRSFAESTPYLFKGSTRWRARLAAHRAYRGLYKAILALVNRAGLKARLKRRLGRA